MNDHPRLEGPPAEELYGLTQDLLAEIAGVLSSDRWVLLRTASTADRKVHSAAILRHVCSLLHDVADAIERGREAAVRVLGRAHVESWLVGMYIAKGGDEALIDIATGYRRSLDAQRNQLNAYNAALDDEIRAAKRANRRISKRNAGVSGWNAEHPERPKPIWDEVPMPTRTHVDSSLLAALDVPQRDDEIEPLPLAAVVDRLKVLYATGDGGDAGFDMTYDLAYRGLSTLGAHPTQWVINAYIEMRDDRLMVRTTETMQVDSLATPILSTAVMQTALLAQLVLASEDGATPVADSILDRYRLVSPAANHVGDDDIS